MATLYTMKPNYEYYLRHGVKYIYSEGALYHADFAELRAWMAAKLACDDILLKFLFYTFFVVLRYLYNAVNVTVYV